MGRDPAARDRRGCRGRRGVGGGREHARRAGSFRRARERRPQSSAATPGSAASDGRADVQVDGRLELLSVAKKAETPAAEGTYWQTTTRSQDVNVVGAKGQLFAVRTTSRGEWSVGVRPGTRSLMVSGLDDVTAPRTEADQARWRAAGSPATVQAEASTAAGRGTLGYRIGTGRPMVMRTDAGDKIYALGPRNVSYQDLRELPSNSGELRRQLEKLYAADSSDAETGAGRTAYVLRQAADLITMPVKPAVRAAAYRVIADLPGVRGLGRVTDPLGREGVGVAFPARRGPRWGACSSGWSWTRPPARCSASRACWSNRRPGPGRRVSRRVRR
ncbi:CU044_5270 family protein [Streptomyces mirabilis]|nr:CU044_5270 family protein [Streptomyces mirabilis]